MLHLRFVARNYVITCTQYSELLGASNDTTCALLRGTLRGVSSISRVHWTLLTKLFCLVFYFAVRNVVVNMISFYFKIL